MTEIYLPVVGSGRRVENFWDNPDEGPFRPLVPRDVKWSWEPSQSIMAERGRWDKNGTGKIPKNDPTPRSGDPDRLFAKCFIREEDLEKIKDYVSGKGFKYHTRKVPEVSKAWQHGKAKK